MKYKELSIEQGENFLSENNVDLGGGAKSFLSDHKNIFFNYVVAAVIFIIYGIQVCPFLDALNRYFFITVSVSLFSSLFLIRTWLVHLYISAPSIAANKKQFLLDNAVFMTGGLALAIGNQIAFDFPLAASIRVIIGVSILGLFISLQLYLISDKKLIISKINSSLFSVKYRSIGFNLKVFMLLMLSITLVTLFLVISKDLEWLQTVGQDVSLDQAALWILYEFIFVCSILAIYGGLIIHSYAGNLRLRFDSQNSALEAIRHGQRSVKVPVSSNDEFRLLAEHTEYMLDSLAETEKSLHNTRDAAIYAISSLAETRDNETGAHIIRTQCYVRALAKYLQSWEHFSEPLSDEDIELIYKSAPLHDIGKVGIPDAILLKPNKLTDDEFSVMKTHTLLGYEAIVKAEEQVEELDFLRYAKEIAISHHEKWDGSGYPYGLRGKSIPLSGRLMALADVYDALISKRVYKPAFSHDKSKEIIVNGRGTHFDPDIVDAFLAIEDEFIDIANQLKD